MVDGTSISASGPGITIAGTALSLLPSGQGLVIGGSTLALFSQVPTPSAITIGNLVVTPNPTSFLIAGTTIWAGGPGVTIDGTSISLQPSGADLVVGSSTFGLVGTSIQSAGEEENATLRTDSGASNVNPTSKGEGTAPSSSAGSVSLAPSIGNITTSAQETQIASSGGHKQFPYKTRGLSMHLTASLVIADIALSLTG